jgi:hypothetical protein
MSRPRQPASRFKLTLDDYRLLADFRYLLRQFSAPARTASENPLGATGTLTPTADE